MIFASHQPNFFPYMGYFYKIAKSDIFILSDDVKFSNKKTGDMHNYNYIKGPHGKQKITLPVTYGPNALIKDVHIFYDQKQIQKMLTGIEQYYGKTPYFETVFPDIQQIFRTSFEFMECFNAYAIKVLCERFGIETNVHYAPGFLAKLRKNVRIIEMCKYFDADTYLCGSGATAYIDPVEFERANVKLMYSDYTPLNYPQRYGDFIPNLSVLDYIFNVGYKLPEGWLSCQK